MRLKLLLIAGFLLGISIQAVASSVKAPNPPAPAPAPPRNPPAPVVIVPPAVPTATFTPVPHIVIPTATPTFTTVPHIVVSTPTSTFTSVPHIVVPTPTPTFTPVPHAAVSTPTASSTSTLPTVTVWPSLSRAGQPILFKAPSDPGTAIQLSIQSLSGTQIFQTGFSRTSRSGGYVWRLQNQSGLPVTGGVYVYILHFKQQGQAVTAQGKVMINR